MPIFEVNGKTPDYVNNARIEVTEDNVFIDFGFADPFESPGENFRSTVLSRVVMNRSTFETFSKHVQQALNKKATGTPSAGPVILSRCPVREE